MTQKNGKGYLFLLVFFIALLLTLWVGFLLGKAQLGIEIQNKINEKELSLVYTDSIKHCLPFANVQLNLSQLNISQHFDLKEFLEN